MKEKQKQVESTIDEELLRKESPVDRPLEEKLSTELKRPTDVTDGIGAEKREAKRHLATGDKTNNT